MNNSSSYKLISDLDIISIPIHDNEEQLVDLKDQNIIQFGPSPEIENNNCYTKIRLSVYNMLVEAQTLLPDGLKFCLYEGYRSLALQKQLFDMHYKQICDQHPNWNKKQIFIETTKLVAPTTNLDGTKNIPPHSTGGAIDIYLIDHQNEVVDMGILAKDWMSDLDGRLSLTSSPYISDQAKYYRTIMAKALTKVGFINYPTEYWHWSYGDRYWAFYSNHSHAIYGIAQKDNEKLEPKLISNKIVKSSKNSTNNKRDQSKLADALKRNLARRKFKQKQISSVNTKAVSTYCDYFGLLE